VSQQNVPQRLLVRTLQQNLDSGGSRFLYRGSHFC